MSEKSYKIRSYLTAVIKRSEETTKVEVHSIHHTNKIIEMPHSYQPNFTDAEILSDRDFQRFITSRYGNE